MTLSTGNFLPPCSIAAPIATTKYCLIRNVSIVDGAAVVCKPPLNYILQIYRFRKNNPLGVVQNCHNFHKHTQRSPYIFRKCHLWCIAILRRSLIINIFKVPFLQGGRESQKKSTMCTLLVILTVPDSMLVGWIRKTADLLCESGVEFSDVMSVEPANVLSENGAE